MEQILEVGIELHFPIAGRLQGLAPCQAPLGQDLVGLGPAPLPCGGLAGSRLRATASRVAGCLAQAGLRAGS